MSQPCLWKLKVIGESVLCTRDGHVSHLSAQPKLFAVVAYLALPKVGRWVRRDVLLATFWPEFDSARAQNALRVTLHRLRKALGSDAIRSLGDEQVSLDPALVQVDFEDTADSGDLLPGLYVSKARPFEDWLDAERNRWRR